MPDTVIARSTDLETRTVDGELVLLDLRAQCYLSLNRTGAELWPLIVEGTTPERLAEALRARFGVSVDVAARDVGILLGQLREADLLALDQSAATESG